MRVSIAPFTVRKRFALTISRGTTAESTNLWLKVEHDGIEGWGEASPFSAGGPPQTTETIARSLEPIFNLADCWSPFDRQQIELAAIEWKLPSAAKAALDTALWDWIGKKAGLPLWQLWGLQRSRIVPTSVTVGIGSPEKAIERLQDWLKFVRVKAVKVKLGSPDGIDADRAMFEAIARETPPRLKFSVDANGGWSLEEAIIMCDWLAGQKGVKYVEQPLPVVARAELRELYDRSPLPIFVDESCHTSADIPPLADRVHGINIKLMKSGGLSEAMRMIHTAKACGLQVMFGCYSDSILANSALAQLSPLADYLDLDSHLNLRDDPFEGATMQRGCLLPNDLPGLGVQHRATHSRS
ncbi:dipeptide epimerase [Oxynema sp. CENA135]|uniref:dipeptide epimerase n=1 Tax=Oxynema sp. CENA135 TaxID=984206 RepID=UPI00190E5178|nr:dipeptide epimerase [Oxynema sp. CENA135]MBK4730998.1 dipeptide epimerase [Oxynema sp. CENA135]